MRSALLFLIACRSLELDPTEFACARDFECGDGTVCLEGRCQAPWICGDGVIQPSEECDDPSSRGCRDCTLSFGYTCTGTIGDASACTATTYRQITGGSLHVCGLRMDGSIECDGSNELGELEVPNELGPFSAVEAGSRHTCAIRSEDDRAICWGANEEEGRFVGQATVPDGLGPVVLLDAAARHTCAIRVDGLLVCWGDVNSNMDRLPSDVVMLDVGAGSFHTCGLLASREIDCWGDSDKLEPADLMGPFTAVTAGYFHTCALRESGAIACWGRDTPSIGRTVPPDEDGFVEIASGHYHNCAVRTDRRVRCWGSPSGENDVGQNDPPADDFVHITAGALFTCGLRDDRSIECWGEIDPED